MYAMVVQIEQSTCTQVSNCRRKDRAVNTSYDRMCSCHFADHIKANGPTLFPWNKDKLLLVPDPPAVKSPIRDRVTKEGNSTRSVILHPLAMTIEEHNNTIMIIIIKSFIDV